MGIYVFLPFFEVLGESYYDNHGNVGWNDRTDGTEDKTDRSDRTDLIELIEPIEPIGLIEWDYVFPLLFTIINHCLSHC